MREAGPPEKWRSRRSKANGRCTGKARRNRNLVIINPLIIASLYKTCRFHLRVSWSEFRFQLPVLSLNWFYAVVITVRELFPPNHTRLLLAHSPKSQHQHHQDKMAPYVVVSATKRSLKFNHFQSAQSFVLQSSIIYHEWKIPIRSPSL